MYALVPLAGAFYAFRGLRKQNVPLSSMNPLQTQIIYQTIGFSLLQVILYAVSYTLCSMRNLWASEAYFLVAVSPLLPLVVQFTTVYEERNRSKFFRRPRGNEDISVVL
uniref:Cation_ATPase_C domain-containing protein n=1 Tax=Caenorhabditis tropicalis TaxID=1561998 RepID=A0A1I7V2D5_9PELO